MERERFSLTLYDYRNELNWIGHLGWPDSDLRRVPVHEQASTQDDYLNLTNWGGTALGVSAKSGGGSSAAVSNIRNIYVYKSEVPESLWEALHELSDQGGPSAFNESGIFGERGESADFPPR